MVDGIYANLLSDEGTVSGTTTVTLGLKAARITITNDSATKVLGFKFHTSESYATLKPTETISLQFRTKVIYLSGDGVMYRILGVG